MMKIKKWCIINTLNNVSKIKKQINIITQLIVSLCWLKSKINIDLDIILYSIYTTKYKLLI